MPDVLFHEFQPGLKPLTLGASFIVSGAFQPSRGGLVSIPASNTLDVILPSEQIDSKFNAISLDFRMSAKATYGGGAATRTWLADNAIVEAQDLRVSGQPYGRYIFQQNGASGDGRRTVFPFNKNNSIISPGGYLVQFGFPGGEVAIDATPPDAGTDIIIGTLTARFLVRAF